MASKSSVLLSFAVAVIASGAQAQTAPPPDNPVNPPSWQGTFVLTGVSQGCAASNRVVGDFGTIVYRPIINIGDPAEGISFFFPRSAETIVATGTGGSFRGSTNNSGVVLGDKVFPYVFNGTSTLVIEPALVTTATKKINITGHITNFFRYPTDCDVDFQAGLLPRP